MVDKCVGDNHGREQRMAEEYGLQITTRLGQGVTEEILKDPKGLDRIDETGIKRLQHLQKLLQLVCDQYGARLNIDEGCEDVVFLHVPGVGDHEYPEDACWFKGITCWKNRGEAYGFVATRGGYSVYSAGIERSYVLDFEARLTTPQEAALWLAQKFDETDNLLFWRDRPTSERKKELDDLHDFCTEDPGCRGYGRPWQLPAIITRHVSPSLYSVGRRERGKVCVLRRHGGYALEYTAPHGEIYRRVEDDYRQAIWWFAQGVWRMQAVQGHIWQFGLDTEAIDDRVLLGLAFYNAEHLLLERDK
ncbi:hypothetical protein [Bifidobacterium sp. ESL0764]|uniref:hypothetical protein n=1 Tax=Bifidobacterium sp. ESL0764 TaxID=2983228 RepID=UPI0023F7146F|nr:hypothetical protein [Bifidobacterium sp. ESL0764]WEV65267.1 hypothetical protein OZX71_05690 [Bifidobacterium sp. ESL0764]